MRLPLASPLARAAVLAALLAPGPSPAQEAAAPPAAAEAPPGLSAAGLTALRHFEGGDPAAALATLEAVDRTTLSPVDRSLLGTLLLETGRAEESWEVLGPMAAADDADAAVLYNAARAALASGRVDDGVSLLEQAAALVPVSPAARELGILRGASGQMAEALRLLRPWVAVNADDVEARLAAVAAALQLERAAEAEALLAGLPEDAPPVRLLRSQAFMLRNRPQEALDLLEGLLAEPPPELAAEVRRLAADAYIQTGRSARAIPLLEERAPRDVRFALLLAEARYRTGDLEGGLAALASFAPRLLDQDVPDLPLVFHLANDYGRLLVAAGRHDEALPYLRLATELRPETAMAWKSLGDALAASGAADEAKAAFARFQELSSRQGEERRIATEDDPVARALRTAEASIRSGQTDEALRVLRQEVKLSPGDPRLRYLEVQALLMAGRRDEALAAAESTVAAFPADADALYQRGVVRLALERREGAEADLRQALELSPEHVAAMSDLAVLLMAKGERADARGLLERVLELRPEDATARRNLAALRGEGR